MKTVSGKTIGIICAAVAVLAVLIIGGMLLTGPKQQTAAPVDDAVSENDLPAEVPDAPPLPESSSDAAPSQPEPEDGSADPEITDAADDADETGDEEASDDLPDADPAPEEPSGSSHMVDEKTGAIYSYDLADYPQPEGMPAVSAMPQNPLPPVSLNGIYDIERTYLDDFVAPNDENNPYHFYFGNSKTLPGVPPGGRIDEHCFIRDVNDMICWNPAMDGVSIGPNGEGGALFVY